MSGLIVTGFPRAGTTLLYCMLRYTVRNFEFHDNETPEVLDGVVTKAPQAVFSLSDDSRAIVMLRDPREVLTSVHPKYKDAGYFVSAHSCVNVPSKGLCEWWAAIKTMRNAHRIRYETLIDEPRRVQRRLGERFGFDYHEGRSFEDFHTMEHPPTWEIALNGSRPLQRRKQIDAARVEEQFNAHPELYEVAREMGY